ncbi:tautomerase family protein [Peribacillus frigoritolerans]|uniref:Tautomerase family protein n=2 Tax=Peribacillus TaxID=2675229 RepID=A0AA90PPX6_9BACI|nr:MULTISPECIES: tautomerase family protein [Peribacillus]MCM3676578.1 tautomerase family protein [Peribacillus simplex]MDP1420092.1 tautomerase family protein [Peribacillus simplex]MDP1454580.1 tautomerase family protein [Peribacillus frigoritolerans]MDR4929641.1 tautomerase family protein [Peribacillus simplex]WHX90627.1 tautomerase family protein [Peribacillus simplex]
MPFVQISYLENEYNHKDLQLISRNVMAALIEEFHVPKKDYFQIFQSHKVDEFYFDPNYLLSSKRTNQLLYILITCGPGRSKQQKELLYKSIANKLHNNCNVVKENVFIILSETNLENWSFGDGIAQMI